MADESQLDVPVTGDGPAEVSGSLLALLLKEKGEVEATGTRVTGIFLQIKNGAPPRYFIEFPPETPSFIARARLEQEGFDVGQHMGDEMLRFYASRKTAPTKAWDQY
jgi:hypothetical protein